jgi:tetratricopeptide (TPR) repeat protein
MRSRRAVSTVPGLALLSALALAIPDGARGETTPLSPQAQEAFQAYLRDPAGNAKVFLDAARQENGTLDPVQAVFLGDAALRIGRYRMATELFQAARDSGDPKFEGAAEIGLAWAALGRGHLDDAYKHLESAGELNPAFRSFTDVTMALVAAADGDPDGRAALAAAAARPDVDPGFREVAPLLDAYARYWAGDADGAAAAFTAFAVAHPDSRFADDAVYAAAQAKQLAGRDAEAQADLEALAGDDRRGHGPLSSRLVALDGRSLLREGMRRDRGLGTRLLPQRIADLLDGNGVRMARAALAAQARESAAAATDAGATPRTARRRKAVRGSETPGEGDTGYGGSEGTRASAPAVTSSPSAPPEHPARFPWTAVLAVGALLLGLGLWLFGRGRTAPAGSR